MAGIGTIYRIGRGLGDTSSLFGGGASISARGSRRIMGKTVGRFQGGLNVFGLIMWAEFLSFLRHEIEMDAAKPFWVGSFAQYAAAIENGFNSSLGGGRFVPGRPYFAPAIKMAQAGAEGAPLSLTGSGGSGARSGLYEGGKYVSSIKAFARGDVAGRYARIGAGRESSKFFWGTLRDPERNVVEGFVEQIRRHAKKLVPVDKGVLRASIQVGATEADLKKNSVKSGLNRIALKQLSDAEAQRRLYL